MQGAGKMVRQGSEKEVWGEVVGGDDLEEEGDKEQVAEMIEELEGETKRVEGKEISEGETST